jgi:hypothetical protein
MEVGPKQKKIAPKQFSDGRFSNLEDVQGDTESANCRFKGRTIDRRITALQERVAQPDAVMQRSLSRARRRVRQPNVRQASPRTRRRDVDFAGIGED